MLRPGTAVPASEQINKRIAGDFQYVQEVYKHLDEIIAVASHLTPVEDLAAFQQMVEELYAQLGLLVEASQIIVQITQFGFDWIRLGSPAAGRNMLELGTAALKDEEYFAKATEFAALYAQVQEIASDVSSIQDYLLTVATKVELSDVRTELLELIAALQTQVNDLETELAQVSSQVIAIGGDTAGLVTAVSQLQTDMTEVQGGVIANASSITALQASLTDTINDVATNASAINTLETEVSVIGDNYTSLASDVTALSAKVTGLEGDVDAAGSAISALTTQVNANSTSISVLSTSVTALNSRVTDAEDGVEANANALSELTTQVEENTAGLVIEAEQRTELQASLSGSGNQLPNTNFEAGTSGWTINQRGAGWASTALVQDPDTAIVPEGRHTLGFVEAGAPVGTISIVAPSIAVKTGSWYFLSGYLSAFRMTADIEARWLNASNALISSDLIGSVTNDVPAGNKLSDWDPRISGKVRAPAGAVKLQYRVLGRNVTAAGPKLSLLAPMVEEATDKQINPSPWSESGIGFGTALANAEQSLTAMISEIDGDVTSLAAAVTALDARVDGVETGVSANASAINSLNTRVTTAEGTITAQGNAITSINAELDTKADASALNALDVRVTENEGYISTLATNLSSVEASLAGKADASAVTLLEGRVDTVEDGVSANSLAVTKVNARLSGDAGNLVTTFDFTNGIGAWASPAYTEPANPADPVQVPRLVIPPGTESYQSGVPPIVASPGDVFDLSINMLNTANAVGQFGLAYFNAAGSPFHWAWLPAAAAGTWAVGHKGTLPPAPAGTVGVMPVLVAGSVNYLVVTRPSVTRRDATGANNVSAISALRANATGSGNLLVNSAFDKQLQEWEWDSNPGGGANVYVTGDSDPGVPKGKNAAIILYGSTGGASLFRQKRRSVTPGKTYIASGYFSGNQGGVRVWGINNNGSHYGELGINTGANGGGGDLSGWTRRSVKFTVPGGVTWVWVQFGIIVGTPGGFLRATNMMLEECRDANQNNPSPWSLGGFEYYASYTLSLDVNGYVSGFQSSNNGQSADFTILADNFRIMKPGGGARTEFSGGNWRVYDASGVLRVRMGIW